MGEKLEFGAGPFLMVCYTDGYPLRAGLTADGVTMRIDAKDIKDLEHVLLRMRTAMRKHYLRPGYNLENDAVDLE